jgi:DNA processing protein
MSDSNLAAWAALIRAPHTGAEALRSALARLEDVTAIARCSPRTLVALGFGEAAAVFLARPPVQAIEADLHWLARSGATLLPLTHPQFPAQLAALPDAPPALYVRGNVAALSCPQLAVVGSRHPTAAGRKFTVQLTRDLCAAGLAITSGLARGIDTAAHEAALAHGALTVAVCGTGLDTCYPPENQSLADRIVEHGALVSEFAPGAPARRQHFPRRNRIIAGLSRGTVVIEAAAGSGSLITARRALDQGRELFAVPGSPLNPLAAGCLTLLREGAHLARGAADILMQIGIPLENSVPDQTIASTFSGSAPPRRLDKDYEMLLDALGFEPASINDLVDRTGLAPGSVASMMLRLELEGRVETRPGALFNRV